MGASTSRLDEDKALQLCRERKKFVQQALGGRCLLATAHVSYVQSLKSTGIALRRLAETEVPVKSSLYTSTSATPEQTLALIEKSVSHFSYSPPPASHSHHDTYSSSPSPPSTSQFQVNHMKFRGFSSKKVEEKPSVFIVATVTSSSSIPQSRSMVKMESNPSEESSSLPSETPPWDYFGLSHPIDYEFSSSHIGNGHVTRSVTGEDENSEVEDDGDNFSFQEREESRDSDDDEFDEPTSDTLVRSFENLNRVRRDHNDLPQREGMESGFPEAEKSKTPEISPPVTPLAATPLNKTPNKVDHTENKLPPRDFLSSMKEIELLFVKASETGKEVPRMLEANKLHFRPIVPSKESGTGASSLFKTCLSCGEDPRDVPEEPAQNSMKYLTWHRTESSRSTSSRNPLGGLNSDDVEELNSNLFENICMIAGSHASTLDRLYAWERKLYDEVKGSQTVRREYDEKCRVCENLNQKVKVHKE